MQQRVETGIGKGGEKILFVDNMIVNIENSKQSPQIIYINLII